jgi:predicted glycosyltransferase
LDVLREEGRTRLVLGLRDILEEPATVRVEWGRAGYAQTIERFYDAIWIYGDPAVYDLLREYGLPAAISNRARFTGYLNPADAHGTEGAGDADTLAVRLLGDSRFVLCEVGGGQDGQRIAQAFVECEMPEHTVGVLLTGPFMPAVERDALSRRAAERSSNIYVLDLISEPTALLSRATSVITMGGYNSVCEVLSHRKRALIIPRTTPRREQLIRAQRLAKLGLIEFLDPARLTPDAISEWLKRPHALRSPRRRIDMNGLERAGWYLEEVIRGRWPGAAASAHPTSRVEASA